MFEKRLPDAIEKQPFKKILEVNYVKRVIEEADGIQPHLVAPEVGAGLCYCLAALTCRCPSQLGSWLASAGQLAGRSVQQVGTHSAVF